MDWVKDGNLCLVAEVPLDAYQRVDEQPGKATKHTRNMSMAICFPLSWKLLIYALETLLVASDKTPAQLGVKRWGRTTQKDTARTCEGALSAPREARVEGAGAGINP